MVVSDGDVGDNAHYTLSLRSTDSRVAQWFHVEPTKARGRTPVVVRVHENGGLDFDKGVTEVSFTVVAHKKTSQVSIVSIQDSHVYCSLYEDLTFSICLLIWLLIDFKSIPVLLTGFIVLDNMFKTSGIFFY